MKRLFRRCGKFIADLFKGNGNRFWELGRILTAVSVLAIFPALYHNIKLGVEIDLGPSGLSGGLAALLTAGGILIGAKDWIARKARSDAQEAVPEDTP